MAEPQPEISPASERLREYSVAYFGNDWSGENRTSSHHIARHLSTLVPVLYIETPGMRAPQASARDLRKLWRKLAKMFAPPRKVHDRLHIMTMPQIPFRNLPMVGLLNRWLAGFLVRRALRRMGFRKLIAWFVVPHPGGLAKQLGEDLTVYYCVDDYSLMPNVDTATIRRMDDHITRLADVIFVAPPNLVEPKRALNPNVFFSPHGVDAELFGRASDPATEPPAQARSLAHPVVGYFGTLEGRVDFELLVSLARSRPQWTFLLIGYTAPDLGGLRECPNVVLPGPQPYETLPQWAKTFDVTIVPYRMTPWLKTSNPLKLREYLATGKPVVTVTAPETDRFAHVIYVADGPNDFLAAIERALAEDSPERSRMRRESVAGLSWESRFQETVTIVNRMLARKTA